MAIKAVGIQKAFGGVRALAGVSLAVDRKEIVGLIGPNGSGKTTLLNVVSGIYAPEAGSVTLDGADITGMAPDKVARLGVARTFQNIRLFQNLTVIENVEVAALESRATAGSPRARARQHVGEMGLLSEGERRAATLNYGSQRRVEIARAVAASPDYLLLDEPAAGMNETESDELLKTIVGLRDRYGFGILVIDHDLRLIMRLCERVVALNQGTIISEGAPHHVQNDRAVAEAYLGRRRNSHRTKDEARAATERG